MGIPLLKENTVWNGNAFFLQAIQRQSIGFECGVGNLATNVRQDLLSVDLALLFGLRTARKKLFIWCPYCFIRLPFKMANANKWRSIIQK